VIGGGGTLRVLLLPALARPEGGPGADPDAEAREWLLPAAAVAEIVSAQGLVPVGPEAPDWLIGTRPWRGVELPAVRLGELSAPSAADPGAARHPYLAICMGAAGDPGLPFFAIESPGGLPRLERVSVEILAEDAGEFPLALAALRLNGRPAAVVDLEALERRLIAARAAG